MNYKKNKKINKDIVLVGFQIYEYSQYQNVEEELKGLDFEESINKLEKLHLWFKPFYKNENTYSDIEQWKENYYYFITIEENNN